MDRKKSSTPFAIEAVAVEGYKSLRQRAEIKLAPLTVIAGVNSSGKSSIMQPLLLLKQTVDAAYDPGPLQLHGVNVSITSIEHVLSKGNSAASRVRNFAVELVIAGRRTRVKFGKDASGNLRIVEHSAPLTPAFDGIVTLREGMTDATVKKAVWPLLEESNFPDNLGNKDSRYTLTRDRFSLQVAVEMKVGKTKALFPINVGWGGDLPQAVSRVIHLPALRGNPKRTYRMAAVESTYPGTFDTYTAGIISYWQNNNRREKIQQLKKDVEELGLTWKVEAKQLDDTQVELLVGRLPHARQGGAHDLVNIADVGFGVSQTLPVVVALLAATPGQLVYLEQPEIHLHPRAQLKFAHLVKRALDRGVRIVVETHSSLFVRAVQTLVARGQVDPEDVALHWFSRNKETGETEIDTAQLAPDGSFGDWPEDFDDVYLGSESAYLDAAMERGASS
ncbi:DUF3696 domain-containing protein [Streptomyces nigra]|uniref:DUF3696 domain-containing protein n=1 Tax=Streptomyces nigra TaxID=1827580 RepID=UPI0038270401